MLYAGKEEQAGCVYPGGEAAALRGALTPRHPHRRKEHFAVWIFLWQGRCASALAWSGFWSAGVKNSWTIQTPERCGKEVVTVLLLGIIVLLLFGYLVYALTHPERF